jgi:hypothetical protein
MVYMQAHWAFYRAVAIGFLVQMIPPGVVPTAVYWGSAIGLGVVFVEALTNPRIRQHLGRVGEADPVIWNMGQAVINALAFIVTGNLYLLLLIQFILEVTVPHRRAASTSRARTLAQR